MKAEQEFSEFVKRMTKQSRDSSDVDWDERRLDWLAELEDLYRRMEQHLKPYTDKNEIQIERDVIRLSEDYLGTYDATKLTFRIGHEKISANPKGTLLIGARGRVDLSGSRKLVKIVLFDEGGPFRTTKIDNAFTAKESNQSLQHGVNKAGWYIASTLSRNQYFAFGKDSFRAAIMEVSCG